MNLEVYVNDMRIKYRSLDDHLADLEENFLVIKHNKVKINLTKCIFVVAIEKFLRFMLIKRGIMVNSAKCKAILEIRSLTIVNEVQRLNGYIMTLSQFMSKLAKWYMPFYKILKKDKAFGWGEDCKKAFV